MLIKFLCELVTAVIIAVVAVELLFFRFIPHLIENYGSVAKKEKEYQARLKAIERANAWVYEHNRRATEESGERRSAAPGDAESAKKEAESLSLKDSVVRGCSENTAEGATTTGGEEKKS